MRRLALIAIGTLCVACPSERVDDGGVSGLLRQPDPTATAAPIEAPPVEFLAWNINAGNGSHDAQLPFIEEVLGEAADYDVITLSEVEPGWVATVGAAINATGRDYAAIHSDAGCRLRLMTLVAEDRFEILGLGEMSGVPGSTCARAPLWVTLRDRVDGTVFEVVGIHLLRGSGAEGARRRAQEAADMRVALERDDVPVVVLGDANMDCPQQTAPEGCAEAFDALAGDGFVTWIEPVQRADTTCRTDLNDMLDLVFAGRGAETWAWEVEILSDRRYCTPNMARGAHFPIRARATW